jgi:hypothetical protein
MPDVALHFRARDVVEPIARLRQMAGIAEQLAAKLGAVLLTDCGQPFELAAAEVELRQALNKLQAAEPGAAHGSAGI